MRVRIKAGQVAARMYWLATVAMLVISCSMGHSQGVETPYDWDEPTPIVDDPPTSAGSLAQNSRIATNFGSEWISAYNVSPSLDDNTTFSNVFVSRSGNNGISWSNPVALPTFPGLQPGVESNYAFRPELQMKQDGTYLMMFDSFTSGSTGIYKSIVTTSPVLAVSPAELVSVSTVLTTGAHSVSVDTDGQGRWLAAWHAETLGGTPGLVVARSLDDGVNWETITEILGVADGRPQVKSNKLSRWIILYDRVDDNRNTYYQAIEDVTVDPAFDVQLSNPEVVNTDAFGEDRDDFVARVDFETSNTWVAVWGARRNSDNGSEVYSARAVMTSFNSTDGGFSWSAPLLLSDPSLNFGSDTQIDPWISSDSHGNWITVWSSQNNANPDIPRDIFNAISYTDGVSWKPPTSLDIDFATDNTTRFLKPVIGSDHNGRFVAMWQNIEGVEGRPDPGLLTEVPWYSTTFLSLGNDADIVIFDEVLTDPIYRDANFNVRFTITNEGPTTATTVTVIIQQPFPTILVVNIAAPPDFQIFGGPPAQCRGVFPQLAPGESRVITVTYNSSAAGDFSIFSYANGNEPDPFPEDNNNVETPLTILTAPIVNDISVTKTAFPFPNAVIGQHLGYVITIRNLGPDPATNVIIQDDIPAGLDFEHAVISHGTWFTSGTSVYAVIDHLPVGGRETLAIATTPQTLGLITNTACVIGTDGADTDAGNDCGSVTVNVGGTGGPGGNVTVSKTVNLLAPVEQGTSFTYTLTATNLGTLPASGVTVTDSIPASLIIFSETHTKGTVDIAGNTVTANFGSLSNGQSASVHVSVAADATGVFVNTANVASETLDPNTTDNSASTTVTVVAANPLLQTDLRLTKTDSPDPVIVGAPLTYTINVGNAGPETAYGVIVQDVLPASVGYAASTPPPTSKVGNTLTYNYSSLTSGTTTSINIVVIPLLTGTITNRASVAGSQSDPIPSNNVAVIDTTVIPGTPPATNADLAVVIDTVAPNPGTVGLPLTMQLTATNNGPEPATSITLTHNLATSCTFVSADGPQGPGTFSGGVVTIPMGFLASGSTSQATITMIPDASGQLTLTGTVSGNVIDPLSANNQASITVAINPSVIFDLEGIWIKIKKSVTKVPEYKVKAVFGVKNLRTTKVLSVPVHFYLSDDDIYDDGVDEFILARPYKKIKPGKTKKKPVKFTRTTDPAGKWLIGVVNPTGSDFNAVPIQIP